MKKNFDFDDLFDEAARNQLKDFEMPFDSEDWKQFERRLDRKDHLLPHLWLYKSLEMFAMVLVVWTIFNFMHNDNAAISTHNTFVNHAARLDNNATLLNNNATQSNANATQLDKNTASLASNAHTLTPIAQSKTRTVSAASTTADPHTDDLTELTPVISPFYAPSNPQTLSANSLAPRTHKAATQTKKATKRTRAATARPQKAATTTHAPISGNRAATDTRTSSALLNDALAVLSNHSNHNNNTAWNNTTTFNANDNSNGNANNTNTNNITDYTADHNATTTDANTATNTTNQASLSFATGYVAIQTAPIQVGHGSYTGENDPLMKLQKAKIPPMYICQHKLGAQGGVEAHSRNSNGEAARAYTLGIIAETELSRKVALSTGLQFSHRAYTFEQTIQMTTPEGLAYTRKEERRTGSNVLSIPLQIQYSVYRDEKWRAYATLGVVANVVALKRYTGTFQTYMPQATGYTRTTTSIAPDEYDGGVFQHVKLANTAYLSVQLGAGVERQLSDDYSLFMQPTFQYGATTYGATKTDRSHVFSLYMGIKKSF